HRARARAAKPAARRTPWPQEAQMRLGTMRISLCSIANPSCCLGQSRINKSHSTYERRQSMDSTPHEPYPPAPWRLRGHSIQALRLIDSSIARDHVPAGLRVVTVWPGKTLAVLYCASYEPPSVLRYHELVVAPALVAAGGRIGFWISRIYVDDAISQAGGRGIWGLPKELASFTWQPDNREVAVQIGEQPL